MVSAVLNYERSKGGKENSTSNYWVTAKIRENKQEEMSHMNFYFIYSQPFLVLNIHISKEIGTQEKKTL